VSKYRWWLEQAERDLRKASNALSTEDYDAAAFWSHQAVEKALNAARGHNLIELGRRVEEVLGVPVEEVLEDLRELNPHYTLSRYPNAANAPPYQIYTRARAEEAVVRARRVVKWVRRLLC